MARWLCWLLLAACGSRPDQRVHEREPTERIRKVDAEKSSAPKVDLPAGTGPEIDQTAASLVLQIPVQGEVVVGGKVMSDSDIDHLFHAAFARDKNTQVVFQADKGVPHARVVDLMQRAKAAGLTRLAISARGAGAP